MSTRTSYQFLSHPHQISKSRLAQCHSPISPAICDLAPIAKNVDCGQWQILAGMRFVLALIVTLGHSAVYTPWSIGSYLSTQGTGHGAVVGFFLISGYSIAASIERERSQYLTRRIWRIYPAYLAAIAIGYIILVLHGGAVAMPVGPPFEVPDSWTLIGQVLMLQGFAAPFMMVIFPTWSLAVEWWLYIAGPSLYKSSLKVLAALVGASLIASFYFNYRSEPGSPVEQNWHVLISWAWAWIAGFAFYRFRTSPLALVMLIAPAALIEGYQDSGVAAFIAVATGLVIYCAPSARYASKPLRGLLDWSGDLSYPLYLLHIAAYALAFVLIDKPSHWLMVALALLLSIAVLHLIDRPARAWARRNPDRARIILVRAQIGHP